MNLSRAIDDAPLGGFHATLFGVSLLVLVLEGIDIQLIGFVAPVMVAEWRIPAASFGVVFSAGLAGAMTGAMLLGSLGDRVGRRPMVLASLAFFGIGTLLTPWVPDVPSLVVLRFLTSLGLGGVVPNVLSLCAELAPARVRSAFVGTVATGQLVGGVIGSLASSWLLGAHGWRYMFVLAGTLSLLTLIPAFLLLPESLRFQALKGRDPERARRVLRRLRADVGDTGLIDFDHAPASRARAIDLFRGGRAWITGFLWLAIGSNLVMTGFVMYYLPTLLVQAGVRLPTAILAITAMNAAGILGGVVLSIAINRYGAFRVLAPTYLLAALSVAAIGQAAPAVAPVIVLSFVAGFLALGGFTGISLLASMLYPTELRSAGVGAAIAASKGGAIAGPLIASAGLAAGLSLPAVFALAGCGGIVAFAGVSLLARARTAAVAAAGAVPAADSP